MKRVNLIFLLAILTSGFSTAQVVISGKVVDRQTSEEIPFAHIFVAGTEVGTTSNLYGNFSIKVPESALTSGFQVTCLGYQPYSFQLSDSQTQPLLIKLNEDVIRLEEVVIKPETAENIMKEALQRIPYNYDTSAHKLSGYYKMSSLLEDKNAKYTEAYIDIVKPTFSEVKQSKQSRKDSTHFREVRTIPSEVSDWKLKAMIDWESTPRRIENRDIVKQFLNQKTYDEFMSLFDFELESMVYIDGRRSYKINLIPKKNKRKAYWNGSIFIDEETKAFAKVDFVSTENMFRSLKAQLNYKLMSSLYNVKYDQGEWKERISYKLVGDKWYFNEVNSSKQFLISSKKRSLSEAPVDVTVEYKTDSVRSNYIAQDSMIFLPYSKNWWENAEYIESLYDSVFWTEFDDIHQLEIASPKPSSYNKEGNNVGYQFTKLDTLQGTLTPLRSSYDVGFYHLDVEVFPKEEVLKGSSLIRFNVVKPTNQIQIDLYSEMKIDRIEWRGQNLSFEREYNAVYINFRERLKSGSIEEVQVFYAGRPVDYDPNIPLYASFLWLEDDSGNPWLQAICQGYGASGWWPNKDHLSDEPDSARISITVPADLDVVSNGRLLAKNNLGDTKTRFDWAVSYPINNYNLTFNVGKYKVIKDMYENGTSQLDLEYHLLEENDTDVTITTAVVKPMLQTFEKYFGPYPFPKDGFKIVESPHAMEHQSCVAIHSGYFYDADDSGIWSDLSEEDINYSIVLHESAHEWWGNNVSCTDNAELWIHEAFATYAEALFVEDHYGYEAGQRYLNAMKGQVLNRYPILGKPGVNHIHYDITDMYTKGALMLNTLRHVLDDDKVWFAILKDIQIDFKYQNITSEQIINYINQKTEMDLGYFFDQYLNVTGLPRLEMERVMVMGVSTIKFRWVNTPTGFKMPIDYLSNGQKKRLYPTTEWNKLAVDRMYEVEINTDQFLIEVE